jgi:hypothetical protein
MNLSKVEVFEIHLDMSHYFLFAVNINKQPHNTTYILNANFIYPSLTKTNQSSGKVPLK